MSYPKTVRSNFDPEQAQDFLHLDLILKTIWVLALGHYRFLVCLKVDKLDKVIFDREQVQDSSRRLYPILKTVWGCLYMSTQASVLD